MDQKQQLPYFPPPPGQPGVQPAPPPLPPRQANISAGYGYPPSSTGGGWTTSPYPTVPVPPPPTLQNPVPSPQGQHLQKPPPLPARPSSIRGLVSNLKTVAQNVHSEARALASTLAQQGVNQYRPQTLTTQPSQHPSTLYMSPNPSHQYSAQPTTSEPEVQYWNSGATSHATSPHTIPPQPGVQNHYYYGQTEASRPQSNTPVSSQPIYGYQGTSETVQVNHNNLGYGLDSSYSSPTQSLPNQVTPQPQYGYHGTAAVPQTQHPLSAPVTINYSHPNTTETTKHQATLPAQPPYSYSGSSVATHSHSGTPDETSQGQTKISLPIQAQYIHHNVAETPSAQYTASVPNVPQHQHQNIAETSSKPVQSPQSSEVAGKQSVEEVPLTSRIPQSHYYPGDTGPKSPNNDTPVTSSASIEYRYPNTAQTLAASGPERKTDTVYQYNASTEQASQDQRSDNPQNLHYTQSTESNTHNNHPAAVTSAAIQYPYPGTAQQMAAPAPAAGPNFNTSHDYNAPAPQHQISHGSQIQYSAGTSEPNHPQNDTTVASAALPEYQHASTTQYMAPSGSYPPDNAAAVSSAPIEYRYPTAAHHTATLDSGPNLDSLNNHRHNAPIEQALQNQVSTGPQPVPTQLTQLGIVQSNITTTVSGAVEPGYQSPQQSQGSSYPLDFRKPVLATNSIVEIERQPSGGEYGPVSQVGNIEDGLNNLSIAEPNSSTSFSASPTQDKAWIEDEWRRPPLTVSENGVRNEVIWDCPGSVRDLVYEANWFHLTDVPDFLICTRCHDRLLRNTALAPMFKKTQRANGRCRFNVPRITSVLLPQCLQTGNIEPLKEFMLKRLGIKDCKAYMGMKGKDGIKWFVIKGDTNDIMINFVSCEACYEDIIQASIYAGEFIPRESRFPNPHPPEDTWMCDMHFPYIKRSLPIFSRNKAPFSDWVSKATKRFQLPKCEGNVVEASSREWVRPRDEVKGLVICEVCYFDQIAWTALEADFEYIPITKPVRGSEWLDQALGYRQDPPTAWTCDAKVNAIVVALEGAVKRQDVSIFTRSARKILPCPPCRAEGISNSTWYTLKGGCDNYGICESCYTAFCEAFDCGQFWELSPVSGTSKVLFCNFNSVTSRQAQFGNSLLEAQLEGDWSVFSNTVRKYNDLPVCPQKTHFPNRKWYGWHDCLICEECYQEVCKETRGSLQFEVEGEIIAENRMCCLYSPRMREKWAKACEQGDATELVEFSRFRHGVYARTVPQMEMLREMQQMQMMTAMSAGFAGLMYQGAQSMQSISGNTDGYLHGNSSVGWHETENGVASAEKFNEMNNGFNAANSGSSWMRIFQLAAEWDKVQ